MTKTVYIAVANGLIGIARKDEPAKYAITDVPDYVQAVDVLTTLAGYEPGRVPAGSMTYRKLESEVRRGFNAWKAQ